MDFMRNDALFFAGAVIIIFGFSWFVYDEIKEDEGLLTEILWEENKGFIIISIILMVIAIIIWREIYLFIINHIEFFKKQYINYIKTIQKIING